jgi:hypothetical protein
MIQLDHCVLLVSSPSVVVDGPVECSRRMGDVGITKDKGESCVAGAQERKRVHSHFRC